MVSRSPSASDGVEAPSSLLTLTKTQRKWPRIRYECKIFMHFLSLPMLQTRIKSLRSQLYRTARDLGNVQAAEKGPASYARRVARRKVYRTTNGMTRKLTRGLGL